LIPFQTKNGRKRRVSNKESKNMPHTHVGERSVQQQLSDLGVRFLLTDLGCTNDCLREESLRHLATLPLNDLSATVRRHIYSCCRCAHLYSCFRASDRVHHLPREWQVPLHAPVFQPIDDRDWQLLGFVGLESQRFETVPEEDWVHNPMKMRVNFVIDKVVDFFSLSLLDVPGSTNAVAVHTPSGEAHLERVGEDPIFEMVGTLTGITGLSEADAAGDQLLSWLVAGKVALRLEQRRDCVDPYGPEAIRAVLEGAGAVERGFDYHLPSGLHTDSHINVGRLCASEQILSRLAAAFDNRFKDLSFDTILTNGWAMATIARRLALLRKREGQADHIDDVICEGYDHPTFTEDILPGSKVLLLVDVTVTGTLVARLKEAVQRFGSEVVGAGALACANATTRSASDFCRCLCTIAMDLRNPSSGGCPRCGVVPSRVFNPVSQSMTERARLPRSPSQFLARNRAAREFWEAVDTAEAYEHHYKEDDTHYHGFVNTQKLLEHEQVGPRVVQRLCERVLSRVPFPGVLVTPDRPRSRLLASMLSDAFCRLGASSPCPILIAVRPRREAHGQRRPPWMLTENDCGQLTDRNVLVVDSAAGHGKTVDGLTRLAAAAGAAQVGAAVLISRLTETCQHAFSARLKGGFHWLFELPIRPVVIRGLDPSLCPACQRKTTIGDLGRTALREEVRRWASHVVGRRRFAKATSNQTRQREVQLHLFPVENDFFKTCHPSAASGATLHALNAAMTDGMAPLALPEILDESIPKLNRAAMVENLPLGVLEWSGEVLERNLTEALQNTTSSSVWRASAEVMAREGIDDWVAYIDGMLDRFEGAGIKLSNHFWAYLAYTATITASREPQTKVAVRSQIEALLREKRVPEFEQGLRLVLETLPE
jgi:orotate phosphoribosyltransferase